MFISAGAQKAKIDAETAVIRTVLAATNQVKNIRYIGQELYKTGKITAFTESDMLTGYEMNEVKTSDYSKETKLSGRDMYQFTNHNRFFEGKITAFDTKGGVGSIILPPQKWVCQFTKAISSELYR
jgi:hypothetical protein